MLVGYTHCSQFMEWQNLVIITFNLAKQIPGKIYGNSGMVHFEEIKRVLSPYSLLQHIERVATPKLVPINCLRYLQTT